jgi:hypothetical protein
MYIEDGKLVLTEQDCYQCRGTGQKQKVLKVTCSVCDGTGKGPRGGKNKCRHCINGWGYNYEHPEGETEDCERCKTTGKVPEDYYDHVSEELWRSLEFKVVASMHAQTFQEAHIGAGCWSTTDYGEYRHGTAGDLIEKVRDRTTGGYPQACNLVKSPGYRTYLDEGDPRREDPDPTMPDYIGIFLNSQGYTVAAVHGQEVKV